MKFAQLLERILSAIGITAPSRALALVPAVRKSYPPRLRRGIRRR
jgi:hypothetical protein